MALKCELFCNECVVFHSYYTLPSFSLGIIDSLWSMTLVLPGYLLRLLVFTSSFEYLRCCFSAEAVNIMKTQRNATICTVITADLVLHFAKHVVLLNLSHVKEPMAFYDHLSKQTNLRMCSVLVSSMFGKHLSKLYIFARFSSICHQRVKFRDYVFEVLHTNFFCKSVYSERKAICSKRGVAK